MAKNIESFIQQSIRFFDAGLLHIIYQTDDLCVCNVANQCYAVFDYNEIDGVQYGYMGGKELAQLMIQSPEALYEYILALGEENISNYLLHFNDKAFQVLSDIKKNNDMNGPSESIDYSFEEEILNQNNKRAAMKKSKSFIFRKF